MKIVIKYVTAVYVNQMSLENWTKDIFLKGFLIYF